MDNSFNHIKFFTSHIQKTLDHFNNTDLTEIQFFSIGLLQRLKHISSQIEITLPHLIKKPELEFALGISIRALLLDTLIGINLYKLLQEADAKKLAKGETEAIAKEYCNKMLADGLSVTISYVGLAHKVGFVDEIKLKEAYNNFAKTYQYYLEPHLSDGSKPKVKFPKAPNISELFTTLASIKELQNISKIYDSYLYYSKYDHFGTLYFTMMETPIEDKFKQLKISIRVFVGHLANLFDILERFSDDDKFIQEQFKIAGDYLLNIAKK